MNKCEKQYELEKNSCASINIGLNNLATLTFSQAGIKPKSDKWQVSIQPSAQLL